MLAEDAASEAFITAFRKWDVVRGMKDPTAWTVTVAANQVRRLQRRRVRRQDRERRSASSFLSTDRYNSDHDDVWVALEQLTPRQREALVLRYIHEATQKETAKALDVAPGTAAATLNQARSKVRKHLLQPNEGSR